jgi:hypothetical protein
MDECTWCQERHGERYLCDPVKAWLEAHKARGEALTMPTLEFSEPLPNDQLGLGAEDRMVAQLVVQGLLVEQVTGVTFPAVSFSGRDAGGAILPTWLVPGEARMLRATAQLVHRMAEGAIRMAAQHNGQRNGRRPHGT